MTIVDDNFPPEGSECIALSKMTIEYVQDLDCCQSEHEYPDCCQTLTITTDDGGGGKFLRICTGSAGWSINNIDELVDLLNDFKQRLKCESR